MKLSALSSLAAFLLFSASAFGGDIGGYLPQKGDIEGHFLRVTYPPGIRPLYKKMQLSLSKNEQWFSEAVKATNPGDPLPYDEKLGLTPDEYKQFLDLNKQATLEELLVRKIQVVTNKDKSISLNGGADLATLADIHFNAAKDTITTPYGYLGDPKPVDYSKEGEGGALGPYKGMRFHTEGPDSGSTIDNPSGKTVSVTLGKIIKTGKCFIMYNVVVMQQGQRTVGIDMILEY